MKHNGQTITKIQRTKAGDWTLFAHLNAHGIVVHVEGSYDHSEAFFKGNKYDGYRVGYNCEGNIRYSSKRFATIEDVVNAESFACYAPQSTLVRQISFA